METPAGHAMKSFGQHPLAGTVHVDEFYIGGEEEGVIGRPSESAKKLVVVALGNSDG